MTANLEIIKMNIAEDKIAPVYLVQGNEQYLMDQARQMFVNIIPDDEKSMNFAVYDLKEENLSNILDDARSMPFFGKRRVIIVDNTYIVTGEKNKSKFEQNIEELVDYLNSPELQTTLVLMAPYEKLDNRKKITKLLKKQSVYLSFSDLKENDVKKIVENELKKNGFIITNSAVQLLFQLTNLNLSQIMNELQKVMLYVLPAKEINEQMVKKVVTKTLNYNVFDLIEFIINFKVNQAVLLYHQLILNGEEPLRLQGLMTSNFRLLLQTKVATTSDQDTAKILGVHPYRIKMARKKGRKFSYKQLAEIYLKLVQMEIQLKTTRRDPELLFELFLLQVKQSVN